MEARTSHAFVKQILCSFLYFLWQGLVHLKHVPCLTCLTCQVDLRVWYTSSCVVEWRPWPHTEPWQAASLAASGFSGEQGAELCTWEIPSENENLPEGVEFRVRKEDRSSSRTWLSQISGPFATAFAAPEKPRAALLVSEPHLAVAISFSLYTGQSGIERGSTELETERGSTVLSERFQAERSEVLNPGHGHCLATRVQISCRQAGDAHLDEVYELKPIQLCEIQSSSKNFSCQDDVCNLTIPATQPRFLEGQRLVFAVRIGDCWRWSSWSSFSKPVYVNFSEVSIYQNISKCLWHLW